MDLWCEKRFADNISSDQLERLLTELMHRGRIAVHVEQLEETFPVGDVYDNSCKHNGKLTILFVGE